jgi:hypothetical protein
VLEKMKTQDAQVIFGSEDADAIPPAGAKGFWF